MVTEILYISIQYIMSILGNIFFDLIDYYSRNVAYRVTKMIIQVSTL